MFENLINQDAGSRLTSDINKNILPRALLFSGENSSGKFTAALEVARILTCGSEEKGNWQCQCASCIQSKSLLTKNLMVMGPRDCSLEIAAAKKAFLKATGSNEQYLDSARYLFLRSIRKLTLRFNGILWKGEPNLSKIGTLMEEINENLEQLDFPRELPEFQKLEKICNKLTDLTLKLENDFLYDSIPINQIRNMEEWAHIKTEDGKKTIIIENADRMLPGVRNALLKILEEPPADCVFILLTSKRNGIMQTILSRVRTYNFITRDKNIQQDIVKRIFHEDNFNGSIYDYLLTYLPIPPKEIEEQADIFFKGIASRQIPEISSIVKKCDNFNPRMELKLFLKYLMDKQKPLMKTQQGCEFCVQSTSLFRQCIDNVTLYNQTPSSALEILLRDFSTLNVQNGGILKTCVDM